MFVISVGTRATASFLVFPNEFFLLYLLDLTAGFTFDISFFEIKELK